jgi:RNA polymerase I-specific transcription initiation factor RRN5
MDVNPAEDSGFEPSDEVSDAFQNDDTGSTLPNNQFETIEHRRCSPMKVDHLNSTKWNNLKADFIPAYLDLFHEAAQTDHSNDVNFDTSTIGTVTWTPTEKTRFFQALDRHGRHDLPALARAVESKSEVEVKAYLDVLRQTEADRQLYYRQTRNISHAELPAAIAIGGKLEDVLNRAAVALAAHEERYDYASRGNYPDYIVNKNVAKKIDAESEAAELDNQEGNVAAKDLGNELFKLENWIELSTRLFMVGTLVKQGKQQQQSPDDWYSLAHGEESPSITQDALSDFRTLLLSFVQRIVQSSIFLAESRIRATANPWFDPLRRVSREDVESALNIVGSQHSSHTFWLEWPQRSGVKIWSGSHHKGDSSRRYIDYATARELLSRPSYRGRHSRSVSRASSSGATDDSMSPSSSSAGDELAGDESGSNSSNDDEDDPADRSESFSLHDEAETSDSLSTLSDEQQSQSDSEEQENEARPRPAPKVRAMLPGQRKRRLDHAMKHYMDEIDTQATHQEQDRIRQLLDLQEENEIKQESDSERPGKRPKVLRKTIEEVSGWQGPAIADWEAYTMPVQFSKESEEAGA